MIKCLLAVTWMKNMKDITNNIRTLKETVNDYVRLSLKHANVMDAGTYFMMAKNVYGTDYAFVTVKVCYWHYSESEGVQMYIQLSMLQKNMHIH